MTDQHKNISPEWLEAHGFALVKPGQAEWNDGDAVNPFPASFDVEDWDADDGDMCYLEKKLDRKQFCIVLTAWQPGDGNNWYFQVYIQEDIGCGFIAIPNQFCHMTEYHFSLLYEAIRRVKL